MSGKLAVLALLLFGAPIGHAQPAPQQDPDLPRKFTFALADVCLPLIDERVTLAAASEATRALGIAPVATPSYLTQSYSSTALWFSPSSSRNIFIGQRGDRPVCRLILADTVQTVEVQAFLGAALPALGFQRVEQFTAPPDAGHNEAMWARRDRDRYAVILIQGPRAPVADGAGDQLMVAVAHYPAAEFEARLHR